MINNMTRQDTLFRQTASKLLLALVLLLVGGQSAKAVFHVKLPKFTRIVVQLYTCSCQTIHV